MRNVLVLFIIIFISVSYAFTCDLSNYENSIWKPSYQDDQQIKIQFFSENRASLSINGYNFTADSIKCISNSTTEGANANQDALVFYQGEFFIGILYIYDKHCILMPDTYAPNSCIEKIE